MDIDKIIRQAQGAKQVAGIMPVFTSHVDSRDVLYTVRIGSLRYDNVSPSDAGRIADAVGAR